APALPAVTLHLRPGAPLPPCLIVQDHDHQPDLPLRQEVLPPRHGGIPRRALARQPRAALRHAPEDEALRELRDRAVVLKVRRDRIEPGGEMPLAVQVIAVAREAVPVVDALT